MRVEGEQRGIHSRQEEAQSPTFPTEGGLPGEGSTHGPFFDEAMVITAPEQFRRTSAATAGLTLQARKAGESALRRSTLQAPTRVGGRAASLTGCELDVAVKSAETLDVKWGGWWERAGDSAARVPLTTRADPAKRLSSFTAFAAVSNKHNENLRRVRKGAAQGVLQRQAVEAQEEPAEDSALYTCCMKLACIGCTLEACKRKMDDHCPFCRTPAPQSDEASLEMIQKRVKVNDPKAMHDLGLKYRDGSLGLEKDLPRAVELFERAAKYGSKDAHHDLGCLFNERTDEEGIGNNMSRAVEHFELAAKQGHYGARHNLGVYEANSGNYDIGQAGGCRFAGKYQINVHGGDWHRKQITQKPCVDIMKL
ncbi:hypothetical protein THAOC_06946 [Thalassiosira oceanica]|uniref:RING-type domain-containing protein n=1 Tax=Thalassiosira oceanica TaxID=159749 RepID=K0T1H6_THAOC|nr:hypothetical protein THAOC_06946 [Thalassiosira oceanica]|eukprot:EJK71595.1 hypothetical protein THAOC_06946 [Thalassiosira oceanica]